MKSISYLDMVKEILSESEFLEFEKCYNNPVKKSVKILSHRGFKNKQTNIGDIVKSILLEERDLSEPDFSYNGNKYSDVLFASRKEGLKSTSLGSHYLHQTGLIYVQEMAASLSVQVLGVQPGDIVLDMCAAPGGKTVQIADSDVGFLISNEVDSGRKKALESNLHRCGIRNVGVIQQDGCVIGDKLVEVFDKVLVDAPCSGEGMQYKSDKKVWQWDEKKVRKLSELQIKLLKSGLNALKAGGELVYSTCTTNVLENEYVVSEVLKEYGNKIELLSVPLDEKSNGICIWRWNEILSQEDGKKVARFWPHVHGTGGFFIAKFRKVSSLLSGEIKKDSEYMMQNKYLDKTLEGKVVEELSKWGIDLNSDLGFIESKFTVNIAPKSLIDKHFENKIPNIEIGLPVFKVLQDSKNNDKKLIPLVGIAQISGHLATKNVIEIDDEQLKLLMEKRDLIDERLVDFEGKFVILKWKGIGVGLVSVQKGIGKNKIF